MTTQDIKRLFHVNDLRLMPEAIMSVITGDKEHRDEVYKELLSINGHDLSYDWFQELYEGEMSQRKEKKQDFTPNTVGRLVSMLADDHKGSVHEPTAGNGSMIIADWWHRCQRLLPWEHFPSEHMVDCWELSDRSIPILLLNLSIRGIMGYVNHGDVLTGEIKQRYILLNPTDDTLAFSDIYKVSDNDKIVKK